MVGLETFEATFAQLLRLVVEGMNLLSRRGYELE